MDVPVIKIELEGMKQSIQNALAVHNDEFNTLVSRAVDKVFTLEVIKAKIEMQVARALDNAIDGLSENYHVKAIVMDLVLTSLSKKRTEMEESK